MPTSIFKLTFAALTVCAAAPVLAAPDYPTTQTFGVPFSKDEAWYRQCMRVEHAVAPAADTTRAPSATCDASGLYYRKRSQAVTSPAEWKVVRECASAQGDNAVLMMLYANGFGVPRDTDIAIHYACSLDFAAKAEMEARIAHLANGLPAGAVFDQCDDITSGRMGAVCAAIRQSLSSHVRAARLDRVARAMPTSAQPAFRIMPAPPRPKSTCTARPRQSSALCMRKSCASNSRAPSWTCSTTNWPHIRPRTRHNSMMHSTRPTKN
jgi:hypothetical protein